MIPHKLYYSAQIILFLEMLKFFYLNNFLKKIFFVKENEESKFEIIILNFFHMPAQLPD
jgi:hypothetical protein